MPHLSFGTRVVNRQPMELKDQEHFGWALWLASGVCFVGTGVAVATVFSGSSLIINQSFPLLVSPFELSLSDVSGGLVADGVADDLGVDVAGTAMGDFFGYEHRDLFSS